VATKVKRAKGEAPAPTRRERVRPADLPAGNPPMNVKQAAAALNISARLVRQYLADGTLRGYREGPKQTMWRVPASEVLDYIARRLGEGGPAAPVVGEYQHLRPRRQP
jgi:excisionase family DNA binding protein